MGKFESKNELQMSQNSKLHNLTTKATIKLYKYILKTDVTLLIIHAQVHDGNNGIMMLIFT